MLNKEENIRRNVILEKIKLLGKMKQYYWGIEQQRIAFNKIVDDLRKIYTQTPNLFSKFDIDQLKYLVNEVQNYNKKLIFAEGKLNIGIHKLPRGTAVLHKKEFYIGVIIENIYRKSLLEFEDYHNEKEYKVFISENVFKLISPSNIIILGSSSVTNCYKCKRLISMFSDRCGKCNWRKCPVCGSCNCNKQPKTVKSQSIEDQDYNKGSVKSNHPEVTNGNSQGKYFPSSPNSHWPKNMQGPYGGRYRK